MIRAAVLGAGMAGICAAAALAGSCDEVVLVERDPLLEAPATRRGVPQARQLHNLLTAAQIHLESLLPDFRRELLASGGVRGTVSADTHVFELGVRMPERDLGLELLCAPRPTIELVARRRLQAHHKNVVVWDETDVTSLLTTDRVVTGARVRRGDRPSELEADIVVDALGCGSPVARWLAESGLPVPDMQVYAVGQWYSSAIYRRPQWAPFQRFWIIFPTPGESTGALVSPLGDDLLVVSLNGRTPDSPPTTREGFLAHARALGDPAVFELLSSSAPVDPPTVFRRVRATWRHYETGQSISGLLPLGDSYACLNPLFGQGISVASWQAYALRGTVESTGSADTAVLTDRYLAAAAGAVRSAWDLGDLVGGAGAPLSNGDFERAITFGRLLAEDEELHRTYVGVWHLVDSLGALSEALRARGVTAALPTDLRHLIG